MGRRAKPAGLNELQGNPGKRRKVATPAPPAANVTAAPHGDEGARGVMLPPVPLTAAGRAVWDELAPQLTAMNFVRPTDARALARLCQHEADFWLATKALDAGRLIYWTRSKHGKIKRVNPLVTARAIIERQLLKLEESFGLTPRARQELMQRIANRIPQLPLSPAAGEAKTDGGSSGEARKPGSGKAGGYLASTAAPRLVN